MERKLTAILAADMVGYSRLMETDERATLVRLKALLSEIIEPKIAEHGGQVVKTTGDGLLATFPSVVEAVQCAIEVEEANGARNADLAPGERIEFRIGVNIGDVIVDGGDIYGDGVNVAARLEAMARPGGICISGAAYNQVKNKMELRTEDLGLVPVKNIAEPLSVHRVLIGADGGAPRAAKRAGQFFRRLGRGKVSVVAMVVVFLLAGLGSAGWYFSRPPAAPTGPARIAVLPFVNMGGDSADNYLGEGIAEDIITKLSSFPTIEVVSRTSSFVYDKPVKVQEVAQALGVNYVLEGSVRKADKTIRVTAQLIDATTGEHVWANRFDEEFDNVVTLQDDVAEKIYASLAGLSGEIRKNEEEEAWRKSAPSLDEYDYYLRGHALLLQGTREEVAKAQAIWQEGLAHFPDSALLRIKLCFVYEISIVNGWSADPHRDLETAWKLAIEAQAMENKSRLATWLGHWVMAFLYQWHEGDFDRSVAEAEATIAMVPREARSRADLAIFMAQAGRVEEALEWAKEAIKIDPKGPEWLTGSLAYVYYLAGRPEDALATYMTIKERPSLALAAIYARLGRIDAARAALDPFRKDNPGYTLSDEATFPSGKNPQLNAPLQEAYLGDLRKAGLPDK